MVLLKNFTASSMSSAVLREKLSVKRSLMRYRKRSQLVRWLLKRGALLEGSACVVKVIKTGE
jgi:hypothetical protein